MELLLDYEQKLNLKSLNIRFLFKNNFTRTEDPFSSYLIYHYFYPDIFTFQIDSVRISFLEKLI